MQNIYLDSIIRAHCNYAGHNIDYVVAFYAIVSTLSGWNLKNMHHARV